MTGGWLEDLLACVHCGFCLPVCPTYEILADENDSPRGRIYLMRAVAEERAGVENALSLHLGRCLGCRACETACPAGVRYGALLEETRSRPLPGIRPGRGIDLLLRILTARPWSAAGYAIARMIRRSRLAALASRVVSGRPGVAAGMLHATRPSLPTSVPRGSTPVRSSGTAAPAAERPSFALLEGCVMGGLYPHVHAATRRTLGRRGYDERTAPGQECCGALHAHAGRLETARELARRNIAAFESSGATLIVTDSAGCGAAMRDYPAWLAGDPRWHPRALALAERVRDVTELLTETVASTEDRGRVAYDAPCHLLHAQGVRDAPVDALEAAGYRVELLPSWEMCCGGAGLYNLLQPEISDRIRERKLQEIREGGHDVVATGNPGCMMFLGAGVERAGIETSVVHPVELIDAAEGNATGHAAYREGLRETTRRTETGRTA